MNKLIRHKVVTPSVIYPILSTDEILKRHCNLDTADEDEDDLLTDYIKSSVQEIERYIGYPLMTQVVEVVFDDPISKVQRLIGNINDIVSYKYYNGTADVEVTGTDATDLIINRHPILATVENVIGDEWPTGTNFRFTCNAGYTVANCPDDIKQACRLLVMSKYENREGVGMMPETVTNILDFHYLP